MTHHRWLAGWALTVALAACEAEAQSVARTFDDVRKDLKNGDIVIVVDETGAAVWGQIEGLSTGRLSLFAGERVGAGARFPQTSRRVFSEDMVIEIRRSDSEARRGAQLYYRHAAGSFAALSRVVKEGDFVTITQTDGRVTSGRVASATATQLTLRPTVLSSPLGTPGRRPAAAPPASPTFQADRVLTVTRGGDSRWNGALIGLGIGLALPIANVAAATGDASAGMGLIPLMGAGGFGVGMLIDGMINRRVEVFSAAPSGSRARAEVRPIVRRDAKGVALSLRF